MPDFLRFYDNFYSLRRKISSRFVHLLGFSYIRLYLIILLGFNLFIWLIVYLLNINVSQDLVILHYNIDFGVDLIGSVKEIFIIPLLSLMVIVINTILLFALARHKDFRFFAHLLMGTSLVVNFFLLIALSSIYLINFR